jgi:hypothetical protein
MEKRRSLGERGPVPRHYFLVHEGQGNAPDEEGAELADIEAALLHAAAGARSIMSDSILRGELDLGAFIDVQDDGRNALARLYFGEAVNVQHPVS